MLNYAPDELRRPPLPDVRRWNIIVWRWVAVLSVQRAVYDDVRSLTVNLSWTWRD